jgi:site-specific recombinase
VCIVGNVGLVVPTVLVFELVGYVLLRRHLVGAEKAEYLVDSFSLLGPTPIFAAFTGVLLWFSSLVAGWFDNWFVLNHMRDTLAYNRDLNFIFGNERCRQFADFIERNISGLSGNISLGFLLGLTPEILGFFGFHLDVRHVTLAAGSLAGAMAHFGWSIFSRFDFWLAVCGIGMIGFLNVVVSFTLAFLVAMRSRNVQAPQRRLIYHAIWQRVRENPRQFLWL